MTQAIRLKIVHQSRLFRDCLLSVLSGNRRFEVSAADPDSARLFEEIAREHSDIVLIDLSLPNRLALRLIEHVHQHLSGVRVILLTRSGQHDDLLECVGAGAHGCVLEQASLRDLEVVIERVLRGETFCSPEIAHSMFTRLAHAAQDASWHERAASLNLTRRELEILHLVADRLSNKQIAKRLSLSLYTVKNHVHNIVDKLHVEDRHEAVEYARQRRWLRHGTSHGSVDGG